MRCVRWLALCLLAVPLTVPLAQETAKAMTLRVRVVDRYGEPVANATVYVFERGPKEKREPLVTGEDGVVEASDVAAGQVRVTIHSWDHLRLPSQSVVLLPEDAPVREVSFELTGVYKVEGRVRVEGDVPAFTERVLVRMRMPGRKTHARPLGTDDEGGFTFTVDDMACEVVEARVEGYSWAALEIDPEPDGVLDEVEFVLRESSGSVSGHVLTEAGEPVEGSLVCLVRGDVAEADPRFSSRFAVQKPWDDRDNPSTDATGAFELDDVPAGSYYLIAGVRAGLRQAGNVGPIEVAAGEAVDGVMITYGPAEEPLPLVFVGTLRGLDGGPAAHREFEYCFEASRGSGGRGGTGRQGHSDGLGRFRIETEVPGERGAIAIWGEGIAGLAIGSTTPNAEGTIDVDAVAVRRVNVVLLREPDRVPIAGATAQVRGGGLQVELTSDETGRCGPAYIDAGAGGLDVAKKERPDGGERTERVELPPGEEEATVEAVFPALGSITGTLSRSPDAPDREVSVCLVSRYITRAFTADGSPPRAGRRVTVPAGESTWRFDDVEPGLRTVVVEGTGHSLAHGARVELEPGEDVSVNIDIPPRATITGSVLGEDGQPLGYARLAVSLTWREYPVWMGAPIDFDGTFRLPNVPAGRLLLRASAPRHEMVESEAEVAGGETVGVELVLERKAE